ncbi:uncharacterized protein LOC116661707 isoform X1 [Camelus ferus]|uniref:Uncharacterized protein LOC116661707 isoform X1 n=1 Tax=Camelus ferus TaxID=419612 RepID=A0A8B8SL43_CAMFR|nr:uncharacterized protein LOC116661707 isoform X1 [Camelus ferus]
MAPRPSGACGSEGVDRPVPSTSTRGCAPADPVPVSLVPHLDFKHALLKPSRELGVFLGTSRPVPLARPCCKPFSAPHSDVSARLASHRAQERACSNKFGGSQRRSLCPWLADPSHGPAAPGPHLAPRSLEGLPRTDARRPTAGGCLQPRILQSYGPHSVSHGELALPRRRRSGERQTDSPSQDQEMPSDRKFMWKLFCVIQLIPG